MWKKKLRSFKIFPYQRLLCLKEKIGHTIPQHTKPHHTIPCHTKKHVDSRRKAIPLSTTRGLLVAESGRAAMGLVLILTGGWERLPKEQIKVTGNEVWTIFKPVSLYDEMGKTRGNKNNQDCSDSFPWSYSYTHEKSRQRVHILKSSFSKFK